MAGSSRRCTTALAVVLSCACSPSDKGGTIIANPGDGSVRDSAQDDAAADAQRDAVVDAKQPGADADPECVPTPPDEPSFVTPPCSEKLVSCINACAEAGDMQCVAACWEMEPESCQTCISEAAVYCSSKQGGCESQYAAYYCCSKDSACFGDPQGCADGQCAAQMQSLQTCLNADQACLSQAVLQCSPMQ